MKNNPRTDIDNGNELDPDFIGNNPKTMKERIIELYKEALKEKDDFVRKIRLAFCLVLIEDRKLLEELSRK